MRRPDRYGIWPSPASRRDMWELARDLWCDPVIQAICVTLVAAIAFVVGLVAGHNCASTYVEMTGGLPR